MPANGLNLVVENTIANLEIILERGGMPAVPSVSSGSRWDVVGKIVAFGRKDLFAGPVWQAIHNYPRNRPLDYPYDIGNQEGAAYTYRFYQIVNEEDWQENAWRGRSLEEVNRLRSDRTNPGATVMDDHACWLAYEYFDALNQKHLGHSIPLLSTECGYLIGEDVDPRYPATSPDLHMAQTLESCRIMMGTSQRFPAAPDYYFCTAFWLLANAQLGSTSSWWETHAWYSDRWQGGALPLVFALKSEPKVARRWHGAVADELVSLYGTVVNAGDCRTLVLYKELSKGAGGSVVEQAIGGEREPENDVAVPSALEEKATATLDSSNTYRFDNLAPGNYLLRVPGSTVEQRVELLAGQQELVLNLDLTPKRAMVHKSRIAGTVRGGAGAMLVLVHLAAGEEWTTLARDDGTFRFVDLPAGEYSLRVEPAGSRIERLRLDGVNEQTVELAVAGWGYTIRPLPSHLQAQAKLNAIYCVVQGWPGLPVRVHADEWSSEPVYTGTAPEVGRFGCELTGLEAGYYIVTVDGVPGDDGRYTQLEARVTVDKKQTPLLEFIYTEMITHPTGGYSQIYGRLIGGGLAASAMAGHHTVVLLDSRGNRQEQAVASDSTFRFANLEAGLYTVTVLGHEATATDADLALDGHNQLSVELRMPALVADDELLDTQAATESVIAGFAPEAAGRLARLVDTVGNEYQQYVDAEHRFHFAGLAAGSYTLVIEAGYRQSDLIVDGRSGLHVQFAELLPVWQAEVSQAGSMPGYSVVRVEVEGLAELPVHIWKEEWEGMVRQTGSKAEYGPYALEFSPLGPGRYMVEPTGLGLWAEVELTGLEALWIHFRKRTQPLGENRVASLASPNDVSAPPPSTNATNPDATASYSATESLVQASTDSADDRMDESSAAPITEQRRSTNAMPERNLDHAANDVKENHYLFVWAPPQDPNELSALLSYATAEQPQVGRDRWLAFDADRVTIVGADEDSLELQEFVQALQAAGVQVDSLATALDPLPSEQRS
ncbi:MAG TPA: carboxypeptidase-like regulatory domain-containing protein [Caldilineaceae bacterium]|nr:carboxypeptidase-like regulatory domain-containing protein [Caldilineaceae bacterium]